MSFKWSGDLFENLKKLQMKSEQAVVTSMKKATFTAIAEAKKLVPVKTGRLRSSITGEVKQEQHEIFGMVGTNVDYAPHVEYGTIKMRAKPYLFPGIKVGVNAFASFLKEAINNIKI